MTFKSTPMTKMMKKYCCPILVRSLSVGATVSAAIVMATSHESRYILSIPAEAKYNDAAAFKYFLIANIIASVYGILVSLLLLMLPKERSLLNLFLVLDMVMIMLLTSSISAAMAIAELEKKGNPNAGWQPICGQFHIYCNHVTGALAAAFLALIFYTFLILYPLFLY